MNSTYLEELLKEGVIPDWAAERLDKLGSEALKEEAVHQLKPTFQEALDSLCRRLERPGGKFKLGRLVFWTFVIIGVLRLLSFPARWAWSRFNTEPMQVYAQAAHPPASPIVSTKILSSPPVGEVARTSGDSPEVWRDEGEGAKLHVATPHPTLPPQGGKGKITATGGQPPPFQTPSSAWPPAPPVEVHANRITPDAFVLSWSPVREDCLYNVYSSPSRLLTGLRKENVEPMKEHRAEWTPETALERIWVVVTAVDPEGRESAYSEAIEVIRHPERSGL